MVLAIRQMDQPVLILFGALAVVLFLWRRHVSRLSISYIPGPKASWLYGMHALFPDNQGCSHFLEGNVKDFSHQKNVGDIDFQLMKQYGRVWRMRNPLGVREARPMRGYCLICLLRRTSSRSQILR